MKSVCESASFVYSGDAAGVVVVESDTVGDSDCEGELVDVVD